MLALIPRTAQTIVTRITPAAVTVLLEYFLCFIIAPNLSFRFFLSSNIAMERGVFLIESAATSIKVSPYCCISLTVNPFMTASSQASSHALFHLICYLTYVKRLARHNIKADRQEVELLQNLSEGDKSGLNQCTAPAKINSHLTKISCLFLCVISCRRICRSFTSPYALSGKITAGQKKPIKTGVSTLVFL